MANRESPDISDVAGRPLALNRSIEFDCMEVDELALSDFEEFTSTAECASSGSDFPPHQLPDSNSTGQGQADLSLAESRYKLKPVFDWYANQWQDRGGAGSGSESYEGTPFPVSFETISFIPMISLGTLPASFNTNASPGPSDDGRVASKLGHPLDQSLNPALSNMLSEEKESASATLPRKRREIEKHVKASTHEKTVSTQRPSLEDGPGCSKVGIAADARTTADVSTKIVTAGSVETRTGRRQQKQKAINPSRTSDKPMAALPAATPVTPKKSDVYHASPSSRGASAQSASERISAETEVDEDSATKNTPHSRRSKRLHRELEDPGDVRKSKRTRVLKSA